MSKRLWEMKTPYDLEAGRAKHRYKMDVNRAKGQYIRAVRKARAWSQRYLAEIAGVGKTEVSCLECHGRVRRIAITKIMNALGLDNE